MIRVKLAMLSSLLLLGTATLTMNAATAAPSTAGAGEMDVCGRHVHDPNFGKPCPKKLFEVDSLGIVAQNAPAPAPAPSPPPQAPSIPSGPDNQSAVAGVRG